MTMLLIAAVMGIIPAAIAQGKGRSFLTWWIFGTLLWIVALPAALIIAPDHAAIAQRSGGRKCPACAEYVKGDALLCRYCGTKLQTI